MSRYLIAAALVLQATLTAQDGASPIPNPFSNSSFWTLHTGSDRHAQMVQKAKGSNPADAIEANFAIRSKLGAVRAARGLLAATPAEFARGARVLIERSSDLNDDGTTLRSEFLAFVADARTRVASFSGDDGADAASAMLTLEYLVDRGNEAAHQQRIEAFLEKYAGSPAAAAMRVSEVEGHNRPRKLEETLQQFRDLAREYDGTDAGAMALYLLGFRLGNSFDHPPDPTVRLVELFDIVKRLETGSFPQASRWVQETPALVNDVYFGLEVEIPPASMPVLYARYLEFVLAHPVVRVRTIDGGVEWIIRNGVGRLGATPVERVATVERFLDDLEKGGFGVNDVRLQRAKFYLSMTDPGWISDHLKTAIDFKEAETRALRALRLMIESEQPAAVLRAHAMLGSHYFGDGRYVDARAHYTALLARYPDAEWQWVTALLVARINERLGQKTAVADYEAVAQRKNLPPAALLSRISAAALREQAGELPAAAAHYREALAAWQSLPDPIRIFSGGTEQDGDLPVFRRFADLKKAEVAARLDRLSKAVTTDEALLYKGRRALELDQPRAALAPLKKLVESHPKSSAAVEGRLLLRRAQLADILTAPPKSAAIAERTLATLGGGAYDSVTSLSKLARSALKVRTNASAAAESLVKEALDEWHVKQSKTVDVSPAMAEDVARIRAELFRPQGGGVYGNRGWNAFEWPRTLPPFVIVSRDIQIKTPDGKEQRVSAPFAATTEARVLFASYDDLALIRMILDKIGGTEAAEWLDPLAVPNQPVGQSVKIAQLWSKFFPMRPGHWGGWELTVYPDVTRITFDRENHALAEFTAGYSGGTVELEKENGVWVAKRIVSQWIT